MGIGCNKPIFEKELVNILGLTKIDATEEDELEEWWGFRGEGY